MGELFGNDIIDRSVEMNRMELTDTELEKYSLTPDDLLFGRRSIVLADAGKCTMVGVLDEPVIFESSILRVTLDSKKVLPRFVFEWLNSPEGEKEIARIRSFTTVAGISGSDLRGIRIPVVSLRQQRDVCKQLSSHRQSMSELVKHQGQLKKLQEALRENLLM